MTVGIDLAAQDRDTASCRIDWGPEGPLIGVPRVNRSDELSVSSDRIAVPAFRCALLLDRLAEELGCEIDRSVTSGRVAETYPAATLPRWGRPPASYKGRDGRAERASIIRGLTTAAPVPELSDEVAEICGEVTTHSTRSSARSSPGR